MSLRAHAGAGAYQRFRSMLGPEQLALVDDDSPQIAADPGRRSGKTTGFIGRALRAFDEYGDAKVCYFAPSDEQGVKIIWDDLRVYNHRFALGLEERWTERRWTRGARSIEVIGFDSRKDAERARGRKFHLVGIDEAQLGPSWFQEFVTAAVAPTTLDFRGTVMLLGTPGAVADGFFFEATHSPDWSNRHHWTCAENPFFRGRDPLREARERYHLTEDSIIYRREWLGQWVVDPDALVYFIPPAAIRTVGANQLWHGNILGLDLGWKDHDAIAAMGIEQRRAWSHLRHMETKGQQTNHQLFQRLMVLGEQFPGPTGPPVVVYDPAGHATKKTIETFRGDAPKIVWVQAEKTRKVEFIEWLNNDLRAGTTTVEAGCSMVREAERLRWKRPGKVAEDADHSDQGDGWLYSWRRARDYLRALPARDTSERDPFDEHMAAIAEREADGRAGYFANRLKDLPS